MRNMYQLLEMIGNSAGASNKARADVNYIADKIGFETIAVHTPQLSGSIISKAIGKIGFERELIRVLKSLSSNGVLLVQVPFLNIANRTHKNILDYCSNKNIKVISFIHDVNDLRGTNTKNNQPFYDLLKYSSAVISHNTRMSEHLLSKGVDPERVINLEIFDYLLDEQKNVGSFKKEIVIGGNLDVEKVKYLRQLNLIKGCHIVLYGPNYTINESSDHIEYKGVVEAAKLPSMLNEGFGLVWDGDSIDSCTGRYGNYLKFNNPHKLSMYIASGLPVIIWDQAAEAEFVRKSGIGITVGSLMDLESVFDCMKENEYKQFTDNIKGFQNKLITGFYARKAIEEALKLL